MRLLDLFCGGGGAGMGYHLAGFEVVGVDIANTVKTYPFEFHKADALTYLAEHGHEFDAVHASPPCQSNTRAKHLRDAQGKELQAHGADMLPQTRAALQNLGVPFVIENVPGSSIHPEILLCGSMFPELSVQDETGRRWLKRHRLFESNVHLTTPGDCRHREAGSRPLGVYYKIGDNIPGGGQTVRSLEEGWQLMGITWPMPWTRLREAIPPPYTRWIGNQLRAALEVH